MIEVYQHFHDTEAYEWGILMSLAVNKPSGLKDFEPKRRRITVDYDSLPGMLKIPKGKKKKKEVT